MPQLFNRLLVFLISVTVCASTMAQQPGFPRSDSSAGRRGGPTRGPRPYK
jgi:hypothetical protein